MLGGAGNYGQVYGPGIINLTGSCTDVRIANVGRQNFPNVQTAGLNWLYDSSTPTPAALSDSVPITLYAKDAPQMTVLAASGGALPDGGAQDFGGVGIGATSTRILTIANTGFAALGNLAASIAGSNAGDFSVSPLTSSTLSGGGSIQVTVTFLPVVGGMRNATLQIQNNDSGGSGIFSVALTGTAFGPSGGTMALASGTTALSPASSVNPGTAITANFLNWTDLSQPLSYTVLVDNVVVSSSTTSPSAVITAPSASGTHTITLIVSDSLGYSAQLAQALVVNTPRQNWRAHYFGSPNNSGNGADMVDFSHDGLVNLVKYAFGLDPTLPSNQSKLPQPQVSGNQLVMHFDEPAEIGGIVYGAEWTTSLASGTWQPVPDTGVSPTHIFSIPTNSGPRAFMRLRVTAVAQ